MAGQARAGYGGYGESRISMAGLECDALRGACTARSMVHGAWCMVQAAVRMTGPGPGGVQRAGESTSSVGIRSDGALVFCKHQMRSTFTELLRLSLLRWGTQHAPQGHC